MYYTFKKEIQAEFNLKELKAELIEQKEILQL